jgi:glucokinase
MYRSKPQPDPRSACAIGVDVGGTKIAAGVITADGDILQSTTVAAPNSDGTEMLDISARIIERLREQHPAVRAIGVGVAGMVDWPSGHIRWAPNNAYHDLALKDLLTQATGLPVVVDNDANVAARAEAHIGACKGYSDFAVLTVGTGIGAGLVLDGKVYRGNTGIGGEFGHLIVSPQGAECGCGSTGCLEAMASGTALGRLGRAAARRDPSGALAVLAGGAAHVNGESVFNAALMREPVACSLFDKIGYWLGVGIASLVNLLDIQVVVIGGGLSATGELLLHPARLSFREFVFSPAHRQLPQIITACLGAEAGMVGAGILALEMARAAAAPDADSVPVHNPTQTV